MIVNEYTYGKYVVELTVEETEIMEKMSPDRTCPREHNLKFILEKALTQFVNTFQKGDEANEL